MKLERLIGYRGGRGYRLAAVLVLMLASIAGAHSATGQESDPIAPQSVDVTGSIAFVNAATKDEIRMVDPNGGNNRRVWAHGLSDPHNVYHVMGLTWRPDASELAFSSTHENWCSINQSDIFAVAVDGSSYRRITQAPSCAGLSAYPRGTVRIPVANDNIFGEPFTGFVYFQGAPSILPVSLPAGGSTVLTFNNVADFGAGFLQIGTVIHAANRELSFATAVDVRAGQTVTTGQMDVFVPTITWEAHSPTWRSDGSSIGYVQNFASLFRLPPNPSPLDLGQELQTDVSAMPDFVDLLAWGPPSKANQLLYAGNVVFDSEGIYLMTEGSATAGQKLLSFEVYEQIRGLAWLPDGSGFIFTREEVDGTFQAVRANVFEYNFTSRQIKRLTNYSNLFAGQVTVSPDGQQIVFDRSAARAWEAPADLWIMNRNGSGQRLLAANGRAPAWSPRAVQTPQRAYLPAVVRPR